MERPLFGKQMCCKKPQLLATMAQRTGRTDEYMAALLSLC